MKTTPIISMQKEEGLTRITQHSTKYMYEPLVNELLSYKKEGTACILTRTNEEAVILMALLRRKGINCKLIQSMDYFQFWNIAEMRYFLKYIDKRLKTPYISDDLWEEAKQITFTTYKNSQSLSYIKRCIELFEQTNKAKYASDFKEFVFESSIEDFCDVSGADIVISTIHKSKGREFDDVYMLISDTIETPPQLHDEKYQRQMHQYYVGMTRAKKRLFVHTNTNCFKHVQITPHLIDTNQYTMPEEIILQLSHKDVYLEFFKTLKQDVLKLKGGDPLRYDNFMLFETVTNKPVAKLSKSMRQTLSEWTEKGYHVQSASVRFIVAWKPKDAPKEEQERAVILADLTLSL